MAEGLAVFVKGVAFPDLALFVGEQHGAAQVVLEVVAVLACLLHGGYVGVPVEGLFFSCGGVLRQEEVVVLSGQVQGVADVLFRVLGGFVVYGRGGVAGFSGVGVLAGAVSQGVVGVVGCFFHAVFDLEGGGHVVGRIEGKCFEQLFSCGYCCQVASAVVGVGLFLSRVYEGGHLVVGVVSVCGQGGGAGRCSLLWRCGCPGHRRCIFSGVVRSGSRGSGGLGGRRCR